MKGFAIAAALLLLSGCSSMNKAIVGEPAEPPPANYRELALSAVRETFFDPYSIRDAQIAEPQWLGSVNLGEGNGWVVCVKANAKNKMGAYIGQRETAFMFRAGKLLSNADGGPYQCGNARYAPFPEVNALS